MNKKHVNILVSLAACLIVGCATVGGTIAGAGIGYVLGDAELGASIGATTGLIRDIWK